MAQSTDTPCASASASQASGSDTANLSAAAPAACPAEDAAFVVATIIAVQDDSTAGISQHNDDVVLEQDGPPKEVTVKRSSRCQVPHVDNRQAVEPFNAHIQPQWSSRPSSASFVQVERLSGVARDGAADASVISDCSERPVLKKGPHETNSLSCSCSGHECRRPRRTYGTRSVDQLCCPAIHRHSFVDQGGASDPHLGSRTAPDRPGPVPPPDLQGFPTSTAPNELATAALPNNFSDVTTLFDRLPPEVAGHTRSPQFDRITPERSTVGYGAPPPDTGD